MNKLSNISIVIFITLITTGCAEEKIVSPSNELVMVQVDLQYGVEGHFVYLKFNNIEYFRAELSESVPLSGPLAIFVTYLPRGSNNLYAFWRSNGYQIGPSNQDSVYINLGDAEKYFLGVGISNDTLNVQVQDSAFPYL